MTCAAPVPYETLVALWAGELTDDAVEAHLFECDACAHASDRLGRLLTTLRGMIPPVLTHAQRDGMAARGTKMLEMTFEPGERGEMFFAPELELVVFTLRAGLGAAERVDLEMADCETGEVHMQLAHVPFDAVRGEVLVACQQHYRQYETLYRGDPEFRVFAVEAGARRQVGAYVIRHVWPAL